MSGNYVCKGVTGVSNDGDAYIRRCNRCFGCLVFRRDAFIGRAMLEGCEYTADHMSYLTLTFDDEHYSEILSWSDEWQAFVADREKIIDVHQRFMKRMIKAYGSLRFFGCVEQGGDNGRVHFHYIVFGRPPSAHFKQWIDLPEWPGGLVRDNGLLTSESPIYYIAKYLMKGRMPPGRMDKPRPSFGSRWIEIKGFGLVAAGMPFPEFGLMSNKPGIGCKQLYNNGAAAAERYRSGVLLEWPKSFSVKMSNGKMKKFPMIETGLAWFKKGFMDNNGRILECDAKTRHVITMDKLGLLKYNIDEENKAAEQYWLRSERGEKIKR